ALLRTGSPSVESHMPRQHLALQQVQRRQREIVDVDLKPESHQGRPVDRQHHAGTPHPTLVDQPGLTHQTPVDQLSHQAGHSSLRQPCRRGNHRPGTGSTRPDRAQHDPQVGLPYRLETSRSLGSAHHAMAPSRLTPATAFLHHAFLPVCSLPSRQGLTINSFKHKTNRCPAVPPKRGTMPLVAGVDSSTQSTKIVVRDAETGALIRQGRAPHPDGTEVNPHVWWHALLKAAEGGLLDDVAAISIAAQQHGMVALDADGTPVRDALLWNDTRSADAATDLINELGGPAAWSQAVGSVPVASFTVTKLRWLAQHEPDNAARAESILLPHDWLTQRLTQATEPVTDRGDASGTGYYDPATNTYRTDLLTLAFGRELRTPRVAAPAEVVGSVTTPELPAIDVVGPGTGDNMAAAL